ncbi:MAG: TolC family protein [Aquificaceae bacterium]
MRLLVATLLTFSFSFSLTLHDVLEEALKNNPELKAQESTVASALYSLKADMNLYLPTFFLKTSYSWFSERQKMDISISGIPPIESTKQNYKQFNVGLREVLYDGGTREAKIDISRSEVEAQESLYKEKRLDIERDVIKAYMDVLSSREIIEVRKKQLEAVESQLKRAEAFYREGLVAITDVLQARVRLAEVQRDMRYSEGNYKVALAVLSKLTGMSEKELENIEPVKVDVKGLPSLEELYSIAFQRRGILVAYEERIFQAKRLKDVERSRYLPKFFLQVEYLYSDQNSLLSPKGVYGVSAGLNVEFQSLEPYYRLLSKAAEEKGLQFELEDTKNLVKLEVKKAYENFLTSKDNLRVAESALRYAEEYYKLSEEQYKNQIISLTDLLIAEASLSKARKDKTTTYYEYIKAYFELLRAVGDKI